MSLPVVENPSATLVAPSLSVSEPAPPTVARFTDTVEQTVDAKFRVTLPAAARPAFAAGGVLSPWPGPCVAAMTVEDLEGGRRIRITLRFAPAVVRQTPPLVVTLDARPPNLQER